MNKRNTNIIGGIVAICTVFAGIIFLDPEQGLPEKNSSDQIPIITQEDLKAMVEDWMNNPDEDDTEQRLGIMKAFYTFEESGQWFSDDQEGRVLYNQIVKMVSFDIPKPDLDEIRKEIRDSLEEQGYEIRK